MTRLSIPSNIWNELRPFSVGFDDLFNRFDNTLEYTVKQPTSYPPYNINKIDDLNYQIEMALAGFNKKDIEVKSALNQLRMMIRMKRKLFIEVFQKENLVEHLH